MTLTAWFIMMAGSLAGAAQKPSVVVMFIDDMGYGDIGPFGNTINQTPNILGYKY